MIGAYHRLFEIEKSFRMSKHDLQARPIYHHKRDSIEAHLTVVFAALAVSRWIETTTGWSIRNFVRTARRYRTIEIQAGEHTITAADPLPHDLSETLDRIHYGSSAHQPEPSQVICRWQGQIGYRSQFRMDWDPEVPERVEVPPGAWRAE